MRADLSRVDRVVQEIGSRTNQIVEHTGQTRLSQEVLAGSIEKFSASVAPKIQNLLSEGVQKIREDFTPLVKNMDRLALNSDITKKNVEITHENLALTYKVARNTAETQGTLAELNVGGMKELFGAVGKLCVSITDVPLPEPEILTNAATTVARITTSIEELPAELQGLTNWADTLPETSPSSGGKGIDLFSTPSGCASTAAEEPTLLPRALSLPRGLAERVSIPLEEDMLSPQSEGGRSRGSALTLMPKKK